MFRLRKEHYVDHIGPDLTYLQLQIAFSLLPDLFFPLGTGYFTVVALDSNRILSIPLLCWETDELIDNTRLPFSPHAPYGS